jgi:predicted AlkP superfamily phosphohydrolase/phosphomutase
MSRTVIFGLDGATFDVLDDLVARGVMPCLGRFMAEGTRATLMSTVPPLTPIAWSSLVTGRTPGHHGITGFFQYSSPHSPLLHIVSSRQLRAETVWSMASRQGARAISLNFVVHQPPPRIDGCVIPGWVPWRWLKQFSHPAGVVERLARDVPDFDVKQLAMDFEQERKALAGAPPDDHDAWIDLHVRRDRQWFGVLRHLMATERMELAGVVFDGVDKLQHLLWPYLDPGLQPGDPSTDYERTQRACWRYFSQLDSYLSETVSLAGSDGTVFVVSDHGFSACRDIVFINTWLEQRGYLAWKPGVPIGAEESVELEPDFYRLSSFEMSHTRAFALTPSSNGVHIAVRGSRGETGIPPDSYDSFRARLTRELLDECSDPATGEPLVTSVASREEAFGGRHMELAPDLTLTLRDHGFVSVRRSRSVLARRQRVVGTHHPDGVFIARGPGVRRGLTTAPVRLVDVTPTVLYALGLGIPEDLEGRVAEAIFTSEHLETHAIRIGAASMAERIPHAEAAVTTAVTTAAGQDAEIIARMKALGYLE